MKKVGLTWLQERFNIQGYQLTHESYIGTVDKIELSSKKSIVQTFKPKYDVKADNPMLHLVFALKYDDFNLSFIKEVFSSVDEKTLIAYIRANPNRKYTRIIGFLYEFTSNKTIDLEVTTSNYEDVIDANKYVVGDVKKIFKWKVNDNLLGTREFCPIIRKTTELWELLEWDISEAIVKLRHQYSADVFKRTSSYLYKKETKSSSEITECYRRSKICRQ